MILPTSAPDSVEAIPCDYEPNVFLMSVLLFFATFLIAVRLKAFKAHFASASRFDLQSLIPL